VGDEGELVYRAASGLGRAAAWALIALGLALGVAFAVASEDREVGAIVGPLVLATAGWLALRVGVRATPTRLIVNKGVRDRSFGWSDVEGFRIEATGGQRRILALVRPDQVVALPIANGGVLLTRRKELTAVMDALEDYRSRHSAA
jgi:hypothetical protein